MLQDIEPYQFNNEFKKKEPENNDYVIIFRGEELLLERDCQHINFPRVEKVSALIPDIKGTLIYLFSIDESAFYFSAKAINEACDLCYMSVQDLKDTLPRWMAFAVATANHLVQWYDSNRYCGKCATLMTQSKKERALCCESCGATKYPNISPAVIVGIIDKDNDKILMTRYANRPFKKLALVAGFTEVGETLENTVKREVMEEVGLRVNNIRYFKSQPWSFSQSILVGFFADLDGSSNINIDSEELSEAMWLSRSEIPLSESTISLTSEMIELFRANQVPVIYKETK